jgi:hypothetical protein
MRKLIVFLSLVFCINSAFAQSPDVAPPKADNVRAEFMNAKYWSKIGVQTDPVRGFTLYSRNLLPNPDGQVEFWVKIIPTNIEQFNKAYDLGTNTAYVLHYATVDCAKKFLLLERTGVYDSNNVRLGNGPPALTPKSARERVKPGSIGAEIFHNVCIKL